MILTIRPSTIAIATMFLTTATLVGCGKSGVPRVNLRGEVTYQGQPVPAGDIRFEPNVSKGGSGPVGFVSIVDGKYDTRDQNKGPVKGPVRITVIGYVSAEAFAASMFPDYRYEVDDIESFSGVMDIVVPPKEERGK